MIQLFLGKIVSTKNVNPMVVNVLWRVQDQLGPLLELVRVIVNAGERKGVLTQRVEAHAKRQDLMVILGTVQATARATVNAGRIAKRTNARRKEACAQQKVQGPLGLGLVPVKVTASVGSLLLEFPYK